VLNTTDASYRAEVNSSSNHVFYGLASGRGYDLEVKVLDGGRCFDGEGRDGLVRTLTFESRDQHVNTLKII
jgi:hypothetical protein